VEDSKSTDNNIKEKEKEKSVSFKIPSPRKKQKIEDKGDWINDITIDNIQTKMEDEKKSEEPQLDTESDRLVNYLLSSRNTDKETEGEKYFTEKDVANTPTTSQDKEQNLLDENDYDESDELEAFIKSKKQEDPKKSNTEEVKKSDKKDKLKNFRF